MNRHIIITLPVGAVTESRTISDGEIEVYLMVEEKDATISLGVVNNYAF